MKTFAGSRPDLERSLVAEARRGNTEALIALLNLCDSQVFRVALKITANHHDAEDVLQDSLLNAYLHLDEFRGEARFSTWLVRIAARQAMSRVRRRMSRGEVSLDNPVRSDDDPRLSRDVPDETDDPETQYLKAEQQRVLHQEIESLDPPLRVVLVMRELGMLSMKDMAGALDITVTVAKSRLFRARQKLRECVLRRFDDCSRWRRHRLPDRTFPPSNGGWEYAAE